MCEGCGADPVILVGGGSRRHGIRRGSAHRLAFVQQQPGRDVPSIVDLAEDLIGGDDDVIEEFLAEVVASVHVFDLVDGDPGLMHFDDEDAELWEEDPQEYIRKVVFPVREESKVDNIALEL